MDELFLLAEKEMLELKHPYVGTEHFVLAYLKSLIIVFLLMMNLKKIF